MSDLSALQPTIFFASCTLKSLVWLPWYFLPELFHTKPQDFDDEDDPLLQDHHVLLMERICHSANIFALVGLVSFYWVNPRLFQYRQYGGWLTALLLLQCTSWLVQEFGNPLTNSKEATQPPHPYDDDIYASTVEPDEDEEPQPVMIRTTTEMLQTHRIFATVGVLLIQAYSLYYGHIPTLLRLAAEPFFVFLALLTMMLEIHVVCASVWMVSTEHHLSHHLHYWLRVVFCGTLTAVILAAAGWHRRVHTAQAKLLRKQLKTVNKTPKMKFV
ncbi:expressed unknown protein [Seminavis robusta]|uniref:Uncharacterized protein n=1 Tax=Seminavis robusta TaxID=568900 RepID=A0A9N8HHM1_9STRA|nr:expressed unknown protein [Seminavis robusta]|eukprot:Sro718_g192120.1 n/a (272) ;mRNA; f:3046-3861